FRVRSSHPYEPDSIDLEQTRAALAAADAHGDDAPLGLAAMTFLEDVAGEPRAGHAEGMADCERAAIDIVLGRIDAELVARIEALARESLVQLPDIDVVDLQALALQQLRHGVDRADSHLVRLAARGGPGHETSHRIEAALLGILGFHQHDRGGAVGELAGISGGDVFARPLHRLELGEAFHGRLGTIALVARDDVVDDALFLRHLVDHLHLGLHRDDLVLELVGLLGGRHAALRLQRIFVLVFAADLVALGDDVGGVDHGHVDVGRVFQQLRILGLLWHAPAGDGDTLDAAGDDAVGAVGADVVRGHRDGLQARRAETIDGHAGGRLRHAGEQRGFTADVARQMRAITEIAVLDIILGDAGAFDRMLDSVRGHAHGRGDVESAAAGFGEPGARIGYDDGFTHVSLPCRIACYGVSWGHRTHFLPGATIITPETATPPEGLGRRDCSADRNMMGVIFIVIPGRCAASNYGAQLRP